MQDAVGSICHVFPHLRIMLYVDDMKLHFRGVTCDLPQRSRNGTLSWSSHHGWWQRGDKQGYRIGIEGNSLRGFCKKKRKGIGKNRQHRVPSFAKWLQKIGLQRKLFFELIKAVIFVICCGYNLFELIKAVIEKSSQ